jgi:flagellar biosynthetic protein FliP
MSRNAWLLMCCGALLCFPIAAHAAPGFQINFGDESVTGAHAAVRMMIMLTAISLAPAILLTVTSFVRISVLFSFLRYALGTQTTPPHQVLTGLALFLTVAIMAPTATELYERGVGPYLNGSMGAQEAIDKGSKPLRKFMLRQTREADLKLFYDIVKAPYPVSSSDVNLRFLIPAFVISELRTAFEMGFLLFIPFLFLDIVVGSIIMSLGMVMLPPALISLPLKIMLFVLVDGWNLLVGSVVRSFG